MGKRVCSRAWTLIPCSREKNELMYRCKRTFRSIMLDVRVGSYMALGERRTRPAYPSHLTPTQVWGAPT